jgi:effector-binding domain-containing protein/uncharacterized protein YndB with AHSA1/START domain
VKVLKRILIGVGALVLLLLLIGLFLPATAHVERSTSIAAPAETVFDLVSNLRRFNEWSPWFEIDPATEFVYSGPEQGVGARLQWSSQSPELGSGAQEIVVSEPPSRVRMRIEFEDETRAHSELRLAPGGTGTQVTWAFEADFGRNLFGRYFGLYLDRALGPYYERGLGNLKVVAEAEAAQPTAAAPLQISEITVPAIDIAYVEGVVALDPDAIPKALDAALSQVNAFLRENGLEQKGPPLAINRFYDESGWGFEAAIPFGGPESARAKAAASTGTVKVGRTYAGRVLRGVHVGDQSSLPDTYRQLEDHMSHENLEPNGRSWEQYMSNRSQTPAEKLETHVYLPIKPGE